MTFFLSSTVVASVTLSSSLMMMMILVLLPSCLVQADLYDFTESDHMILPNPAIEAAWQQRWLEQQQYENNAILSDGNLVEVPPASHQGWINPLDMAAANMERQQQQQAMIEQAASTSSLSNDRTKQASSPSLRGKRRNQALSSSSSSNTKLSNNYENYISNNNNNINNIINDGNTKDSNKKTTTHPGTFMEQYGIMGGSLDHFHHHYHHFGHEGGAVADGSSSNNNAIVEAGAFPYAGWGAALDLPAGTHSIYGGIGNVADVVDCYAYHTSTRLVNITLHQMGQVYVAGHSPSEFALEATFFDQHGARIANAKPCRKDSSTVSYSDNGDVGAMLSSSSSCHEIQVSPGLNHVCIHFADSKTEQRLLHEGESHAMGYQMTVLPPTV